MSVPPPDSSDRPRSPSKQFLRSLPCLGCGYDLRGMRVDGRCPECGAAAEESLAHLALAEPAAVSRLARGALAVAIGSMGVPAVYLLNIALMSVLPLGIRSELGFDPREALILLLAACPIVTAWGWIRIAAGHPTLASDEQAVQWRQTTRVLAAIYGVGAAIAFLASATGAWTSAAFDEAANLALCVLGAVWFTRNWSGLRVVGELAHRCGARRGARAAGWWRVINGLAAVALLLAGIAATIVSRLQPSLGSRLYDAMVITALAGGIAIMLAVASCTLANIAFGFRLRSLLSRAAKLGEGGGVTGTAALAGSAPEELTSPAPTETMQA